MSVTATTTSLFGDVATQTMWGTYAITKNTLALEYQGDTTTLEYSFSNNDNTLTLIGGEGPGLLILTRQ